MFRMNDIFTRLSKLQQHIQRCESVQLQQQQQRQQQQKQQEEQLQYEPLQPKPQRQLQQHQQLQPRPAAGPEPTPLFQPILLKLHDVQHEDSRIDMVEDEDDWKPSSATELSMISLPNVNIVDTLPCSNNLSIESNLISFSPISVNNNPPVYVASATRTFLVPESPAAVHDSVVPSLRTLYAQLYCLFEHLPPSPQEPYRRNICIQSLLGLFKYLQDNGQFGIWADVLKIPGLGPQITSVKKWHDALPAHIHGYELQ